MTESSFQERKTGIYIHIPFCVQKCNYCAFLSFPASEETRTKYIESLIQEISLYNIKPEKTEHYKAEKNKAEQIKTEVDSIYFGGGTPALLEPEQIEKIVYKIKKVFAVTGDVEITLEANPGALGGDEEEIFNKLSEFGKAGVNRLSFGVQSMNDDKLHLLGRVHSASDVVRDFEIARDIGFDNISLDIILSVPTETRDNSTEADNLKSSIDDVKKIIELKPEHISCYSLQLEEGTVFYDMAEGGLLKEIPDAEDRNIYHAVCDLLKNSDYEQYEISNFALKADGETENKYNYRSRHNSKYWDMSEYIGFGLGASGFLKGKRYRNTTSLEEYCRLVREGKKPIEDVYINNEHDFISEAVFTGLRRIEGISYREAVRFLKNENFGNDESVFWGYYSNVRKEAEEFEKNGYLEIDRKGIRLTETGIDISNRIMALFV
ncbi:MAG TPA: radical SAM family heme chaperone HemW [Mogibacterium sp.]|nr:radical SAM family heme chaperone HemW [Mogibacterium sp.]